MKEQKKEEINKQAELEDKLELIETQLISKKKEKKGLLSKIFG